MRRLLIVFLAVFVPVLAASAQELTQQPAQETVVSPSPEPAAAAPQAYSGKSYTDWQVTLAYQFNGIRLHDQTAETSTTFHTSGINGDFVRFFKDWFGVEGMVGAGFGKSGTTTIPNNLDVKTVFLGGGVHIAYRSGSRWEPWGHGLIGMEHYRFTQTAGLVGSNTSLGWLVGGGVDYHIGTRMAIRGEGDYLGSHILSVSQHNYQILAGLVLNF